MLKQILEEPLNIEGVTTVALIARDGFVIEFAQKLPLDMEALGALGSCSMKFFHKFGDWVHRGPVKHIELEYYDGAIVITRLSQDEFLAIITDTKSALGQITFMLPKISARVATVL
jgi:predicted regulator of Ras-like GTPase activity (Roadblock/LC7/MglB family)